MSALRPKFAKKSEQDEGSTTLWLITYSDMVTLLLAFLLLIYAFSSFKEEERAALVAGLRRIEATGVAEDTRQRTAEELEAIAKDIAEQFGGTGDDEAWVETNEAEVTVGLPASITFEVGKAELTPRAHRILGDVATQLAKFPNAIRIEGHTDNLPIRSGPFRTNWHLSTARAQNVIRLFITGGVAPERLQVVGYADTRPRDSNDTAEGRRANRRIEIKLVRSQKQAGATDAPR